MITVQNTIDASIDKIWELWTLPEHIIKWNSPSSEWHTPSAENDLRERGKFKYAMVSKDKSQGFDFKGIYTKVEKNKVIAYKLFDNRTGIIYFENQGSTVKIVETFEPEAGNSESMQQEWCQNVIDNFKKYVEHF